MKRLSLTILALLVLCGLATAQSEAPAPERPEPMMRSYLVYASKLTITPEAELTMMRFSGGVRIEGRGLNLYTDSLELTLVGEVLPVEGGVELPEGEIPSLPEALEDREKGEDLAQIARELELPKARFQSDSVRRLKALGNVRFEGHGVVISTHSVESTDGGRTWQGSGRTTLSMSDANGDTQLSADGLHFDSEIGIVTAQGHITGSYMQPGVDRPLLLETEGCRFDMNTGLVSVPGEVRLSYDGIDMLISPLADSTQMQQSRARELEPLVPQAEAGEQLVDAPPGVSIDLDSRAVRARGSVHVEDPKRNISLDAFNLDYMMDEGLMTAWQVELTDIGHGMTLSAPLVEIYTNEKRLEASGMPLLRYRSSSYTGERIIVTEESKELLVIEIEGQQLATLHLDELQDFGEDGDGGEAATEAQELTITHDKSSGEQE